MSLHKQSQARGITPSNQEENQTIFHTLVTTGETIKKLSAEVEEGKRAAQRLVEGNMGYVVSKAEKFLDEFPRYRYLKDDLISEGFLVLARVAKRVLENGKIHRKHFNPQAMMSVSLRNAFLNLVYIEREVPLSGAVKDSLVSNEHRVRDLMLDIMSCCQDDREREVVRLRCDGLNDTQIGESLNLAWCTVARMRQRLFERLRESQENSGHFFAEQDS